MNEPNWNEWRISLFGLMGRLCGASMERDGKETADALNAIDAHLSLLRRTPPAPAPLSRYERHAQELAEAIANDPGLQGLEGVYQVDDVPPDADRPTCRTCRFFDDGTCKRYPPQTNVYVVPAGTQAITEWPSVWHEGWCGEHQPRQERNP